MEITATQELETYVTVAKEAGCPADQAENFLTAGYIALPGSLPFHALARQIDNHIGVDQVLLDGTRGSAKSHTAIAQIALDDCQRFPGIKCLFLRQTQKAAGESFDDLITRVLRFIPHKKNTERVTFPNGSRILIGGYQNDNDIDKYLGIEYDIIAPEEATQISGPKVEKLRGSLRTSRDDFVPRMYYTTNPGGIGHQYFKQTFIDPQRAGRETTTRRFFSSYKDNPFINPEYKAYLESLTGTLAKQWRDGDWDIFEGMAFSSWRHELHVIKPFEIPAHYIRMTGTDWGFAAPFVTLWAAKNPDNGRVVVYRGVHEKGLTDPRQAELIKSSEDPKEKIRKRYADPSMWAKKTSGDVATSTADVYRAHGIYLTLAVNDRINGKRKVDKLLEPLADGLPGLLVFENVFDLIRTLPSLVYDKTHPEDVDTSGDDHCLVAGTLVTTARGDMPIEIVNTDDMVLTRSGFRKVEWSGMTSPSAKVFTVKFSNGSFLVGTAKHPVFVEDKGFVSIDALRYGDIIVSKESVLCQQRPLFSTALSSGDIQTQNTEHVGTILRQGAIIENEESGFFIKKSGKVYMDQFQKDITYITRTITPSTTISPISFASLTPNIFQAIKELITQVLNTWPGLERSLLNGTAVRRGESGTENTVLRPGLGEGMRRSRVSFVAQNTHVKLADTRSIVQRTVGPQQEEDQGKTMLNGLALSALERSRLTNIQQSKPAQDYVVQVCDVRAESNTQPVYNLTIDGQHEFFANGVLVHNCYDALRYLLTDDRDPKPARKPYINPLGNMR